MSDDLDLDFSYFHPLDHSIWECRDYPGGRRTHARYVWQFKWDIDPKGRVKHFFGYHKWLAIGYRNNPDAKGFSPFGHRSVEDMRDAGWSFNVVCDFCDMQAPPGAAARAIADQWGGDHLRG